MALFVRLLAVFLFVASPPICGQALLEKAREMQAQAEQASSSSTHHVHFLDDGKASCRKCRKLFCWNCVAEHPCVAEKPAEPGIGCKRGSRELM